MSKFFFITFFTLILAFSSFADDITLPPLPIAPKEVQKTADSPSIFIKIKDFFSQVLGNESELKQPPKKPIDNKSIETKNNPVEIKPEPQLPEKHDSFTKVNPPLETPKNPIEPEQAISKQESQPNLRPALENKSYDPLEISDKDFNLDNIQENKAENTKPKVELPTSPELEKPTPDITLPASMPLKPASDALPTTEHTQEPTLPVGKNTMPAPEKKNIETLPTAPVMKSDNLNPIPNSKFPLQDNTQTEPHLHPVITPTPPIIDDKKIEHPPLIDHPVTTSGNSITTNIITPENAQNIPPAVPETQTQLHSEAPKTNSIILPIIENKDDANLILDFKPAITDPLQEALIPEIKSSHKSFKGTVISKNPTILLTPTPLKNQAKLNPQITDINSKPIIKVESLEPNLATKKPAPIDSFVEDESIMLQLKDDDVVLGKLTHGAMLDQIDFDNYVKLFWEHFRNPENEKQKLEIDKFLEDYDNKHYGSDILPYIDEDSRGNPPTTPPLNEGDLRTQAIEAAQNGDLESLRIWVDNYPLLNVYDEDGNNLLAIAVMNDQYFVAEYLLLKGIEYRNKNAYHETALDIAIKNNSFNIIKLLQNATRAKAKK